MALPKGVKSPVDYRGLYSSNEMEGDVIDEGKGKIIATGLKALSRGISKKVMKTPITKNFRGATTYSGKKISNVGKTVVQSRGSSLAPKGAHKAVMDVTKIGIGGALAAPVIQTAIDVKNLKKQQKDREFDKKLLKDYEDYIRKYESIRASYQPNGELTEKAVSQQQQKFMGMVYATKKGKMKDPSDEVLDAAMSMSMKDAKKYASTKHDKLPKKIEEKLDSDDKPFVKKLVGKLRKGSKTHAKQADDLEKAMNEQLGGTGPKVAPSSEEMKKKLTNKLPSVKELGGLGGGGGGTNAITAKAKTKTFKNYVKDAVKIATFPISRRGIKPDPTEKFATESIEDEALTIQDWNSDDVNYTEIETVDIIKPKPLVPAPSNWREELGEDWQKVNRKDKTDGLSKKAVKAYRRENPGSKLQTAVTTKPSKLKKGSKSAKRRLSFCRRMKGMKKKLTSAKTRRDPDSRINKALRRWNC